ncbi:MAG: glycoside hydrolase 100 family protein [Bacteroidota bacterium]
MEIYKEARALLGKLSGPHGIRASLSEKANYAAVFTRDAVMAGIAGLLCELDDVADGLVRSLEELRNLQGPQGQIASNFTYVDGVFSRVSFGTLSPKVDAATWYVVGVCFGIAQGRLRADEWRESVEKVIALLDAMEYNGRHLIYVPMGGNWADEYIDEGYVLYDQVLRAWGLQLAGDLFDKAAWREKATTIWEVTRINYWPQSDYTGHPLASHTTIMGRQALDARAYPCSCFTPAGYRHTFDLAACCLLTIASPLELENAKTLDWIETAFLDANRLPPAFYPVIAAGDAGWEALSNYHLFDFKNKPHHYHNGGIWLIWLGWLALAFYENGRTDALAKLGQRVDAVIAGQENFAYEEYFDGLALKPGGEKRMAYSASGLLMLQKARSSEISGRLKDAWR